jgi:hypothetical protein
MGFPWSKGFWHPKALLATAFPSGANYPEHHIVDASEHSEPHNLKHSRFDSTYGKALY